jgi:drug/metabolite transporter (DMT)-like permease
MSTPATPTIERPTLARGYTIALISAAILSLTAIFIRYLTETYHLPALVLAFWREVFVVVSLLIALAALGALRLLRIERRHLPYLVGYGFVLAIFNALWTLSVSLNGAAISTVLAYSSGAFTALLGWWLLGESFGWVKMVAVALSLGGCVLVSGALDAEVWLTNPVGILTGLLSGLAYAVYSLMGRSASLRGLNTWGTLFYIFGFAAPFMLALNLLGGGIIPGTASQPSELMWLGNAVSGWGILLLLAAGPTLAGYGMYNLSLSLLPSSVANLILTLEPAFTALIAHLLLGEDLTLVQVSGGLLTMAGVAFLRLYEGRRFSTTGEAARETIVGSG